MTALAEALPAHVDPARVVDINIYALPGQTEDFHLAWSRLMESAPDVVWTPQNEGHWIALGGEIMAEVQADHTRFSNRIIVVPKSVGAQHGLIPTTIDPPEHRPYRKLLNDSMSLAKVRRMHDAIRKVAVDLIEGFRARGHCNFTSEYAEVLPIRVFMALVDLPEPDAEQIRFWAQCMTRPDQPMSFPDAKQAFYDYLEPIITARRAMPGSDLISEVITADIGGRTLDHAESLAIATQILIAGVDTVVNFLGFAMLFLARNPDACTRLAAGGSRDILAGAHELFRRYGLVVIARTVREDMLFHGAQLKAGELVCIPTQVHGLDARVNADPLAVDFDRRGARHSAFGSGPHMCPGQELARAEVAITIEEWLKRIPHFRLAADADTQITGGIVAKVNRVALEWDA